MDRAHRIANYLQTSPWEVMEVGSISAGSPLECRGLGGVDASKGLRGFLSSSKLPSNAWTTCTLLSSSEGGPLPITPAHLAQALQAVLEIKSHLAAGGDQATAASSDV